MKIVKQADQNPEPVKGGKLVFTPRQEELVAELSERMRQSGPLELNADTMTKVLQEYIQMKKDHDAAGEDWQDY